MPEKDARFVVEEQTGRVFEIKKEKKADQVTATISVGYLILMILFFLWQLFDIWVGKFTLAKLFGYADAEPLTDASTLICIFTFIGGALGAIVNEIRGVLFWHCDHEAFGRRYIWKSIIAPWLGGTLGIFVYFLMRSGIALFTGEFVPSEQSAQQGVPMFAIGILAGYGGRKVFIWLDYQVGRLFKLKKSGEEEKYKKVPNLVGMTKEEAEKALADANLTLGNVSNQTTTKSGSVGKVIAQEPKPELSLAAESVVEITIGVAEEG